MADCTMVSGLSLVVLSSSLCAARITANCSVRTGISEKRKHDAGRVSLNGNFLVSSIKERVSCEASSRSVSVFPLTHAEWDTVERRFRLHRGGRPATACRLTPVGLWKPENSPARYILTALLTKGVCRRVCVVGWGLAVTRKLRKLLQERYRTRSKTLIVLSCSFLSCFSVWHVRRVRTPWPGLRRGRICDGMSGAKSMSGTWKQHWLCARLRRTFRLMLWTRGVRMVAVAVAICMAHWIGRIGSQVQRFDVDGASWRGLSGARMNTCDFDLYQCSLLLLFGVRSSFLSSRMLGVSALRANDSGNVSERQACSRKPLVSCKGPTCSLRARQSLCFVLCVAHAVDASCVSLSLLLVLAFTPRGRNLDLDDVRGVFCGSNVNFAVTSGP